LFHIHDTLHDIVFIGEIQYPVEIRRRVVTQSSASPSIKQWPTPLS